MLLYGISYIDRLILSLLAPAMSAQLQISDVEMGVLIGLGFGVLYTLAGLPLAHLIDRRRRISLVTVGVVLWSLCTIASAFAPSFTGLIIFRSGVAVGEAVLLPAAISLITDLFPRDRRTLPTTLYTGVGAVMYSGSYIAGGAALQLATAMSGSIDLEPWQLTLMLVGIPGLLLAPLLWITVPKPPRVGDVKSEQFATTAQALAYLSKERMLYGCLLLGNAAVGNQFRHGRIDAHPPDAWPWLDCGARWLCLRDGRPCL
ncbi:MAG: MFS transporter [Sphingomonadaceae bacterium]